MAGGEAAATAMKPLLKFLHVAAAIGFVGTLAVSLLLAAMADATSPSTFAALRGAIARAASEIGLPSLVLLGVTGALLVVKQPLLIDARWVWAKALLGTLVAVLVVFVVQPAISRAAALTAMAVEAAPMAGALDAALRAEWIGGLAVLALSLLAIAIAVWRPRLGKRPAA